MIIILKQEANQAVPRPFSWAQELTIKGASDRVKDFAKLQPHFCAIYWGLEHLDTDTPIAVIVYRGGAVTLFYAYTNKH